MKYLNIARLISALASILSPIMLLVASTPIMNLPTPFDVIFLSITLTWFIPRLRSIHLRGIIVASQIMTIVSGDTRRVGVGVIAFSDDIYAFSGRVRRFIDRWERE